MNSGIDKYFRNIDIQVVSISVKVMNTPIYRVSSLNNRSARELADIC